MSTQSAFFHALLRPSILQILRATGYHSAKPSVVDAVTDLAARYLSALCQTTASHATHNHGDATHYTVLDVRTALQDMGALQPERTPTEQAFGGEDTRGMEQFIEWFAGQRMRDLVEMGAGDETDTTDYLSGLKRKHAKTADESKYTGTLIGKPLDCVTTIQVEGGALNSISEWNRQRSVPKYLNGRALASPSPSSGLSSVGSRLADDDDMDLS